IRGMLRDRMPSERVRTLMTTETALDRAFWRQAGELGWFGLALPEDAGGAGYGLPEAMVLFVELGRAVAPGPWLGCVGAAHALAGTPAGHDALAGLLAGTETAALVDDPGDRLATGVAGVADAGAVQGVVVLGARSVRWVPASAATITVEQSIDPTR